MISPRLAGFLTGVFGAVVMIFVSSFGIMGLKPDLYVGLFVAAVAVVMTFLVGYCITIKEREGVVNQ